MTIEVKRAGLTSSSPGIGDVVGPGSSTDNAIVRFDGTTGKLIQNSGITIDDTNNTIVPDNAWIGLGGAAGRIEFDDQATDEVNILNASVGIGTSTPTERLTVKDNGITGDYILGVHADDENPFVAGFFNDSYSLTVPGFEYFIYNNGEFRMGTPGNKILSLYVGGYTFPVLTCDTNFRVGIHNTAPASALHITGASPLITLDDNIVNANSRTWGIGNAFGSTAFGTLGFFVGTTDDGAPSTTPKMAIDKSGNVGIGVTAPAYKLDVDGIINVSNNNAVFLSKTGTNRSLQLYNSSPDDNFPALAIYPTSGTNVGAAIGVVPKGTGYATSGVRGQIFIYNTDVFADATNYEFMSFSAYATGYALASAKNGTGTVRPIFFDATGAQTAATSNLFLAIDGTVGIGTTVPGKKLEINSATGDNLRLTYNDNNGSATVYTDFLVSSGGILTIDPTGNKVVIPSGASSSYASLGGSLFDHFADVNNSGTAETDLYSDTLAASTFGTNGDKVIAQYGGTFVGDATSTQRLKAYFGGTLIFDSGALGIGASTSYWDMKVTCIRESSSIVRCSVSLSTSFATLNAYATYTKVTGLTLTNTQILKITGTAAGVTGASSQITASEGYVEWKSAA